MTSEDCTWIVNWSEVAKLPGGWIHVAFAISNNPEERYLLRQQFPKCFRSVLAHTSSRPAIDELIRKAAEDVSGIDRPEDLFERLNFWLPEELLDSGVKAQYFFGEGDSMCSDFHDYDVPVPPDLVKKLEGEIFYPGFVTDLEGLPCVLVPLHPVLNTGQVIENVADMTFLLAPAAQFELFEDE